MRLSITLLNAVPPEHPLDISVEQLQGSIVVRRVVRGCFKCVRGDFAKAAKSYRKAALSADLRRSSGSAFPYFFPYIASRTRRLTP
jgi:hypothetical protein